MIDVYSFSCYLKSSVSSCHRATKNFPCLLNKIIFFVMLLLHCRWLDIEHLNLNLIIKRYQYVPQDLLHSHNHGSIKLIDYCLTNLFYWLNLQLRNALLASHQWVNVDNEAFCVIWNRIIKMLLKHGDIWLRRKGFLFLIIEVVNYDLLLNLQNQA